MTFPDLKLVTAPDSSATVLIDLNATNPGQGAAPREVQRPNLSFGAPELLGEADAVEPLYGPRTIQFTVRVTGPKARAIAFLSALARVLLTGYTGGFVPGLWLRVQLNPLTQPVWFRLRRPNPQALSWDYVAAEDDSGLDIWDLPLELPADPFGYGALETLAAQTVNNDPTHATNPCRIVLPTIKGDAPAPLRVRLTRTSDLPTSLDYLRLLIATHAVTGASAPAAISIPIGTSDGLTAGTDTAAGNADASAIGTRRVVSFTTTPTMALRLSGSTGNVPPGRYKALLRCRQPVAGTIRLDIGTSGPTRNLGGTVGFTWLDLGDFSIPVRPPVAAADRGPATSHTFSLSASRSSGAASLDLDHLMLIPLQVAETVASRVLYVAGPSKFATIATVVDAETEDAWTANKTTGVLSAGPTEMPGVFPRVVPGCTNLLTLFLAVDGGDEDSAAAATSVVTSYYPRYLNVPGE